MKVRVRRGSNQLLIAVPKGARSESCIPLAGISVSTKLRSARVLRIVRRLEGADYFSVICYDVHLSVRPRSS